MVFRHTAQAWDGNIAERVGRLCGTGAGQTSAGAGQERARFPKFLLARGGFKCCECGAGANKNIQPDQDSTAHTAVHTGHTNKWRNVISQ